MAEIAWEKPKIAEKTKRGSKSDRMKFLIGGGLILAAVIYLMISSTMQGARFFITVEEVVNDASYINQTVRVSGAVIGESIDFDSENLIIRFTVANIPNEFDDLATALHEAVTNPDAATMQVVVRNEPMPDLLQHEAQAILTGELDENGVFNASELLLKCPSRFEEGAPEGLNMPASGS